MSKLLAFRSEAGDILIQVPSTEIRPAGALDTAIERVEAKVDRVFETLNHLAQAFQVSLQGLGIDSAELEVGLQLTGKGKVYVVEAQGEASFKAKITFRPRRAPGT